MAADLSHLISEDAQMSMELKDEMKGCVSENVMFLQWGELCNGSVTPEQKPEENLWYEQTNNHGRLS